MTDPARIAASLSEAQRDAIRNARWIHPGGMDPICLVKFTDAWPQGLAQFFTMGQDRLTPLGLSVAQHIKESGR